MTYYFASLIINLATFLMAISVPYSSYMGETVGTDSTDTFKLMMEPNIDFALFVHLFYVYIVRYSDGNGWYPIASDNPFLRVVAYMRAADYRNAVSIVFCRSANGFDG